MNIQKMGQKKLSTAPVKSALKNKAKRIIWAKILAFLAPLILIFCAALIFVFAISGAFHSNTNLQNQIQKSADTAVVKAGLVTKEDYSLLRTIAQDNDVPWQILAVLSYNSPAAAPPPTQPASNTTSVATPAMGVTSVINATGRTSPLGLAFSREGLPYVWGAAGPNAFDCSGLVANSFAAFGLTLPHRADTQYKIGPSVGAYIPFDQRQPGDLIFWDYDHDGTMEHVAFSVGGDRIFHAPSPSRPVGFATLFSRGAIMPYVVRIPGAATGENIPPTTGSTAITQTQLSVSTPVFTGGNGRFHLNGESSTFKDDATTVAQALASKAKDLSLGSALRYKGEQSLRTDDTPEGQRQAKAEKEAWIQAISALPIASMDATKAAQTYDTALTWFSGNVTSQNTQQCQVSTVNNAPAQGDVEVVIRQNDGDNPEILHLDNQQLANARTMMVAAQEVGASVREMRVMYMVALTESHLYNYANSSVPQSLSLPHDKVGSDHDSLGVFQQRVGGWGNPNQLMDIATSTKNFLGADGRSSTLPGLRDIHDRDSLSDGQLAQKIQVSAFPGRYARWSNAADALISALGNISCQ